MLNYKELYFAADQPYPEPELSEKGSTYGKGMLDNMGGVHAEMSAISLYLYNHMIVEK